MNPEDNVIGAYVINESITNPDVTIFTKNGMVKRTNLNDFIISRYSKFYMAINLKKGETSKVSFYLEPDEFDSSSDEVIIDVRVTKGGVAEEGAAEKLTGDIVIANMSELRTMFAGSEAEELKIKFRFYRSTNKDELYTSQQAYTIKLFKDSI